MHLGVELSIFTVVNLPVSEVLRGRLSYLDLDYVFYFEMKCKIIFGVASIKFVVFAFGLYRIKNTKLYNY
tara:strand:- start:311 stop:520 length:210 start_codon:yes stop_codon:yes gene_type:complete